jgi:hypothetical protein
VQPIDTSALPVSVQQALKGLPATMDGTVAMTSSDLGALLFGDDAASVELSPAAQGLIANESANELSVTDAAHAIGLADWPPAEF